MTWDQNRHFSKVFKRLPYEFPWKADILWLLWLPCDSRKKVIFWTSSILRRRSGRAVGPASFTFSAWPERDATLMLAPRLGSAKLSQLQCAPPRCKSAHRCSSRSVWMICVPKCFQDQFCANFHAIARASKGNSKKPMEKPNDGKGQHFHCSLSFFQRQPAVSQVSHRIILGSFPPAAARPSVNPQCHIAWNHMKASEWDPSPPTKKAVDKSLSFSEFLSLI